MVKEICKQRPASFVAVQSEDVKSKLHCNPAQQHNLQLLRISELIQGQHFLIKKIGGLQIKMHMWLQSL